VGNYVGDIYHNAKVYPNRFGVSVLRMRDFAPLGTKWLGFFFWGGGVPEKGYSRDARTDFDAKTSNYVVPRKEVLFGVTNPISKVSTPIPPKTAILGPISTRQNFFARKAALTMDGSRVNDPQSSS